MNEIPKQGEGQVVSISPEVESKKKAEQERARDFKEKAFAQLAADGFATSPAVKSARESLAAARAGNASGQEIKKIEAELNSALLGAVKGYLPRLEASDREEYRFVMERAFAKRSRIELLGLEEAGRLTEDLNLEIKNRLRQAASAKVRIPNEAALGTAIAELMERSHYKNLPGTIWGLLFQEGIFGFNLLVHQSQKKETK